MRFEVVINWDYYLELEFVALVSLKRLYASQIPETKLNLVMVRCIRDFYNCPEHVKVGNILHCL